MVCSWCALKEKLKLIFSSGAEYNNNLLNLKSQRKSENWLQCNWSCFFVENEKYHKYGICQVFDLCCPFYSSSLHFTLLFSSNYLSRIRVVSMNLTNQEVYYINEHNALQTVQKTLHTQWMWQWTCHLYQYKWLQFLSFHSFSTEYVRVIDTQTHSTNLAKYTFCRMPESWQHVLSFARNSMVVCHRHTN